MAGVDQHMSGFDMKLLADLSTDIAKITVGDRPDLSQCHGVHRDNERRGTATLDHQGLGVQRIVDRTAIGVRDVDLGDTGQQASGVDIARGTGRNDDRQRGDDPVDAFVGPLTASPEDVHTGNRGRILRGRHAVRLFITRKDSR